MRVCLDCGIAFDPAVVKDTTRCAVHKRARQQRRDAIRGTPAERGYDAEYQRNRRALLASGPHPCHWGCGRVATTADHLVALRHGGTNVPDNLVPACKFCNSSRGSRPAPWRPPRGAR